MVSDPVPWIILIGTYGIGGVVVGLLFGITALVLGAPWRIALGLFAYKGVTWPIAVIKLIFK